MGVGYNASIITNGLVLCLDAANRKSYSGSGSTWYDLSGRGYNCVFSSTPTWSSSGYFTFNGTSNYGTITNTPVIDWSSGQTVMIVMNHTNIDGRRNPWDQAYGGYGTWTHETGSFMNYYYGNGGGNALPYTALGSTASSTPINTWYSMCITRNTSTVTWYKNTTNLSSMANPYGTLANTTANIRIGLGYSNYWAGNISMILAYTRALTSNEIGQNFSAIRGRYGV